MGTQTPMAGPKKLLGLVELPDTDAPPVPPEGRRGGGPPSTCSVAERRAAFLPTTVTRCPSDRWRTSAWNTTSAGPKCSTRSVPSTRVVRSPATRKSELPETEITWLPATMASKLFAIRCVMSPSTCASSNRTEAAKRLGIGRNTLARWATPARR